MVHHRVITEDPPNTGVEVERLTGDPLSQQQMYVRCNFSPPLAAPSGFELIMPTRSPKFITTEQFRPFEKVTRDIVLECAGNGRALMSPAPGGVQWALDGASAITVSGYRLTEVLGSIPDEVVEVVFTGADTGEVGGGRQIPYQFSISRRLVESTVPVLVTHIGGEPLDRVHGGPIRLIVPGHYGMMSVKWLTRVEGVTTPFHGHFVEKYRYFGDSLEEEGAPVDEIAVRAVIASPLDGDSIPAGAVEIRGSAWSGSSEIAAVEVSVDGGETWHEAELVGRETGGRWAPVRWAHTAEHGPGRLEIVARATDDGGTTQPLEPRWNANGYGNNVVHRLSVDVV